jgi:hypothetical protein
MAGNKTETQIGLKINGEIAAKTIRELESEVKSLNREMRLLPVGSQEFADKAKELGTATNRLNEVRNATRQVREQMAQVGDTAKKANADILGMTNTGRMIQDFATTFTAVRSAVMANVAAMGALRLALAATGIGAIIIALTSLYTWFTKTDEGAKKLEGITTGLGLAFKVITGIVAQLGEAIFKAFENPKQALIDLSNLILNNLINRFTAFGIILDGIINADMEKITNGTVQLGTGIENATVKVKEFNKELTAAVAVGNELAELNDKLDEDSANNLVKTAQLEQQITRLILQSKDRTKTEQERLAILDRASALERQKLNQDLAIAQQKTKIAELEFKQIGENDVASDEARRKFREAQAEEIALRTESINLQEKITNRRNQLLDSIESEQEKSLENQRKMQEDADKAALDYSQKLTDLKIANIKDEYERKDAEIMVAFERELANLQANGQLTAEIAIELEKKQDAALLQNRIDRETAEEERKKKKKEDELKAAEEELLLEEERQTIAVERLVASETIKEEKLFQVKRAGLDRRLKLLQEQGLGETAEAKKIAIQIEKLDIDQANKRIELAKKTKITEDQLAQARLDLFRSTVGGIKAALAEDETNRRKFSGIIKALTIAEIAMQGVKEVQGIWANANMNALNALIPGWGPAFAAIQSAFAITRTTFAATKAAGITFEKGGMITPKGGYLANGGRHSEGGIQLLDGRTGAHLGEVERGEFLTVFSRTAYQNNKSTIDALLNASLYRGGAPIEGRKYADGGMIDLGTKAGAGGDSAAVNVTLAQAQIAEMRRLNDAFTAFPKQLSAVVVYEQQQKQHQEAARIESRANG